MRGKGDICIAADSRIGITPAYAGKSFQKLLHNPLPQDHPRLCGEKRGAYSILFLLLGSPPPMRGKAHTAHRIRHSTKDHPRLCGEKLPTYIAAYLV